MINKQIFNIAEQLKNVVNEQMAEAKKALLNLPEGETKEKLEDLLRRATSGKVTAQKAQEEINEIIKNAGTN